MAKRGMSVSIRVHPTIKIVIDLISAQHRVKTGKGLSNDEVLWGLIERGAKDAAEQALEMGASIPTDARRDRKPFKRQS